MSENLHPQTNSLFPPISIWCPNNCCDLLVQLYGLNYLCYFSLFKYDVWWLPTYKTKEGHTPWTHFDNLVRRWTKVLFSLFLCNFQPSEKILHEANIIIWLSSGVFIHVISYQVNWSLLSQARRIFSFQALISFLHLSLSRSHEHTHTEHTAHFGRNLSHHCSPVSPISCNFLYLMYSSLFLLVLFFLSLSSFLCLRWAKGTFRSVEVAQDMALREINYFLFSSPRGASPTDTHEYSLNSHICLLEGKWKIIYQPQWVSLMRGS